MSKVEQRSVIGIVPTQVPDEDIVRVYGPDGLVEAIEVRDRTFMMGVRWHPEYFVCLATVFSTFWLPGSDNLAKEPPMSQISAFPSIKALSILLLVPLNSTSLPWWTTLSIIAEASLSSPRIVPHLLNSMLVVNTTLRFS